MQLDPQPSAFRSWKAVKRLENPILAHRLQAPPLWAHDSRSRGRKAKGRAWERKFYKLIHQALKTNSIYFGTDLIRGQWFAYSESALGAALCYAQTDFIALRGRKGLVVETKTTRTPDGVIQLLGLYRPIVLSVWPDVEWSFCQAFKHWAGKEFEGHRVFTSTEALVRGALEEEGFDYADLHIV